ncbi:hypothetical protein FPQ18DRAFT_361908 [Pyronema domesticum]|nr:hypothetical protein FPQ18DRAFT_361908 [Pyronema domesticum]
MGSSCDANARLWLVLLVTVASIICFLPICWAVISGRGEVAMKAQNPSLPGRGSSLETTGAESPCRDGGDASNSNARPVMPVDVP